MKRLSYLALVIVMCLTIAMPAYAADTSTATPIEPEDYGQPYEEYTYYDEDLQATVTERSYFVPDTQEDSTMPLNDSKGSGWFKNTKDFKWSNDKTATTYARGYFTWANGKVSVSNEEGGYNYFPSDMEIVTEELTTGTGKYGLIFNNYAYVQYTFKFKNVLGKTKDLSVRVCVSESGNQV